MVTALSYAKGSYKNFSLQNLFDVLINDIFVIFIIVAKQYKCPECGEEVDLDKFNDHVKNRHKENLDIK